MPHCSGHPLTERGLYRARCCRAKRGGRVVKVGTTRVKQPFRQARSSPATSPYTGEAILRRPWQATVSAAQGERRLRHGFCPQWQKPQFAARARHTVAMRNMRGSPPYTGEAIKQTKNAPRFLRTILTKNTYSGNAIFHFFGYNQIRKKSKRAQRRKPRPAAKTAPARRRIL